MRQLFTAAVVKWVLVSGLFIACAVGAGCVMRYVDEEEAEPQKPQKPVVVALAYAIEAGDAEGKEAERLSRAIALYLKSFDRFIRVDLSLIHI